MRSKTRLLCSVLWIMISASSGSQAVHAQPKLDPESRKFPEPQQRPILEVRAYIGVDTHEAKGLLSYAQLKEFKQHSTTALRPWFDNPRKHTGPLLREVMDFLKAKGSSLKIIAHNGYTHDIPIEDIENFEIILAIDKDDKPVRVRERGPIYITYPLEEQPERNNERYYARSVWMVKSPVVE